MFVNAVLGLLKCFVFMLDLVALQEANIDYCLHVTITCSVIQ